MKHFSALLASSIAAFASAQSIPNPGFESNCDFDLTGWNWFCSVPDAYPTDGHNSCYALALPTSDGFDPCFSNGEAIGVHTLMSGIELGVPYELSVWYSVGALGITSDVGIFSVPAGEAPYWNGSNFTQVWPVMGASTDWQENIMDFTVPEQYTGLDFYFFIEYSVAPDQVPGLKYFDDITITDLSTGVKGEPEAAQRAYPNPATDELRVEMPGVPTSIVAIDATGRAVPLNDFRHSSNTLEVNITLLPPGVHILRFYCEGVVRSLRLIKT